LIGMLLSRALTIIPKGKDWLVRKKKTGSREGESAPSAGKGRVKFEVHGEEMLEKRVSLSGNSGRIYLPPDWVGHQVKIIRIN
jgi:putative transposon-encoded protein